MIREKRYVEMTQSFISHVNQFTATVSTIGLGSELKL